MKNLFLIVVILLATIITKAQNNPYEIFGHTSNVVYETPLNQYLYIINTDTTSQIHALVFIPEESAILFLNKEQNIIAESTIEPNAFFHWLSTDPLANEYPSLSPYVFVGNNPINAIDPDGRRIIFVNGYYNTGAFSNIAGSEAKERYWGSSFEERAESFFGGPNTNNQYVDGRMDMLSSATQRYDAGYEYAKANFEVLTSDMVEGETIKIVAHSQGCAYGAGMTQYFIEQGVNVETVVYLSSFQSPYFQTPDEPNTYQLSIESDPLDIIPSYTGYGGINSPIQGVDKFGVLSSNDPLNNVMPGYPHGATKEAEVFNSLTDLLNSIYLGTTSINTTTQPGVDNTGVVIQGRPTYGNTGNSSFNTIIGE